MISKEAFLVLFEKYQQGKCTPAEKELVESFRDDMYLPDEEWDASLGDQAQVYDSIKARLHDNIHMAAPVRPVRRLWYAVAASVLVLVTAAAFLYRALHTGKEQQQVTAMHTAVKQQDSIAPGGNKAYLTMADGTVVALSDAGSGAIATEDNVQLNKLQDGVLAYQQAGDADVTAAEATKLAYNTISIPRGGQFQLILSDGTKVWMNSASTLKYPARFAGGERKVELTGEAYFEVAENKSQPFSVSVNGTTVHVLGTHFNIMGYNDEKEVKTTLLEGAVKLSANERQVLLKPGEQGAFNAAKGAFQVNKVDIEEVMAWKNGFFVFNHEDIYSIMKRISRWYDVDVEFSKEFKAKNFGGTVSRFKDVSQVLRALELTGSVRFKIEGRKIIVLP